MMSGRAAYVATLIVMVWLGPASAGTTDERHPVEMFDLGCGPVRSVDTGTLDYRLKDVTPAGRKGVSDLDRFHTRPAAEEMQQRQPYPGRIVDNLDFSLRHSPNHHEALRLLIRWELSGGNLLNFPDARCALDWARKFTPDDAAVYLYGGIYFWKTKELRRAEAWYSKSLEIRPDSAEAHYQLGLFYYDQQDLEKAREHARAAYAGGFPLPGLRDKLAKAGYPIDSEPGDRRDAVP